MNTNSMDTGQLKNFVSTNYQNIYMEALYVVYVSLSFEDKESVFLFTEKVACLIFAFTFPILILFVVPCIVLLIQNCGSVECFIHLL